MPNKLIQPTGNKLAQFLIQSVARRLIMPLALWGFSWELQNRPKCIAKTEKEDSHEQD
jgi:hypothetical protein